MTNTCIMGGKEKTESLRKDLNHKKTKICCLGSSVQTWDNSFILQDSIFLLTMKEKCLLSKSCSIAAPNEQRGSGFLITGCIQTKGTQPSVTTALIWIPALNRRLDSMSKWCFPALPVYDWELFLQEKKHADFFN